MENETAHKKDSARERIILFAIGVLLGAVIATVAFFVSVKTLGVGNNSGTSSQQMQGGTPPEMPSGDNSQGGHGGTPSGKPDSNNSQSN